MGHGILVVKARFVDMKRGGHEKNGPSFLDGHHPSGGKAAPVADAVHLVDNGFCGIPGSEKITVQAMGASPGIDGFGRGGKSLAQNLAAENVSEAKVLALAAEEVFLDFFEF